MNPHFTQENQLSQGNSGILCVQKRRGETLSDLLERIKKEEAIPVSVPVTYAGRLDPMADGLVILLIGEKCKEKDSFLKLDKKYRFTILFGISTDTHDVLGKITKVDLPNEINNIEDAINEVKEKTSWEYPMYSSKPVNGVPLFVHARNNKTLEELPKLNGKVKSIELIKKEEREISVVAEEIIEDIKNVNGDFRQEEIISHWEEMKKKKEKIFLYTFQTEVSSGVYIRSIATEIGKKIKIPTLAFSITRVAIENYM